MRPDLSGPAAVVLLAGAWMTWDAGRCLRARVTHAITVGHDERARWAAWEANAAVLDRWRAELAADQQARDARSVVRAEQARQIRPHGVPVDLTRGT